MIEITTQVPITVEKLKYHINTAIQKAQNSEDGIMCSEEGIKQIFSYIEEPILEFNISQYDYNFEFGRD